MNSRHFNDRLLLSIILVCCYPQIWCGLVVKGQATKNINFTSTNTELASKLKKTTTVTTAKPELETTTLNLDLDGRSAFINNQFVADEKIATSYNSTPLHDLLQKQLLTEDKFHYYSPDSPQMRETLENVNMDTQKLPNKPMFTYNLDQFDDYEEEETSEYGSDSGDTLENCEDTQESVDGTNDQIAELIHEGEQSIETKQLTNNPEVLNVYKNKNKAVNESNNFDSQTNTKQGPTHVHDYVSQSVYETAMTLTKQQPPYKGNNGGFNSGYTAKPVNLHNTHNKYGQIIENGKHQQPQQLPFNQYILAKPLEHQNPYDRSKPQTEKSTHYYIRKTTTKPTQNNKSLYNSNYTKASIVPLANNSYNNMVALSRPNYNYNILPTSSGSSNNLNPSLMPNFSYGNYNKGNSSPFSTTVGQNKKYRTVSSSTQYVSTPFADLVFKYSIGMAAKHLNSKVGNNSDDNQAQIFHVINDIDAKTE